MKPITRKDVKNLIKDPLAFAMMMDNHQIEDVIATLVCVLNKRKTRPR